jgi:protocatechuate 3,4-dioxygenase beta subunit
VLGGGLRSGAKLSYTAIKLIGLCIAVHEEENMHSKLFTLLLIVTTASVLDSQDPPGSSPSPNRYLSVIAADCVVSGTVVRHLDNYPVEAATVQLTSEDELGRTIGARTDSEGRFEFDGVAAGKYRIEAMRTGYVVQKYGRKLAGYPKTTLTLKAGQKVSDLTLKLTKTAVIAGRIFDDNGEPMRDATVSAFRQVYVEGRKQFDRMNAVRSNDLGEYRLYGLVPGRYLVTAELQGWNNLVIKKMRTDSIERGYARTWYPSVLEAEKSSDLNVTEGGEIPGIDILLKQVAVYRIRGRVQSRGVDKGSNAQVMLVRRGTEMTGSDFAGGQHITKTGDSFEIAGVLPGKYSVLAQLTDQGKRYLTQEDVDVVDANVGGLVLTIGNGVNVLGRIKSEVQSSLDSHRLTVSARPIQFGPMGDVSSRVDENQQFYFRDLSPGVFHLSLSGLCEDCYIKEVKEGDAVLQSEDFTISEGAASSLQIMISTGARLTGIVTNENGVPMPAAWVVSVPQNRERRSHDLYKFGVADEHGRFDLRGVTPGKYLLFSWAEADPGSWEDEHFLRSFEEKGVPIEVKEKDTKNIELRVIDGPAAD